MPSSNYTDREFSLDNKTPNKKKRSAFGGFFSAILFLFVIFAALAAVLLTFFLKDISKTLPTSQDILTYEPNLATVIYDRNNKVVTHLFQENRNWVKLADISPWMVKAILAAEDNDFYDHSGIQLTSIIRAGIVDFVHRGAKQGASTITQQLARNLFLTKEKTIVRKAKEAVLALRLEKVYTKDQILEMYLNTIYMGHGAYGIDAAAKTYYGKKPKDLTIAESAILAGLVAAPEKYSPLRSEKNSTTRKEYVLRRMLDLDWISKNDYDQSLTEKPRFRERPVAKSGLFLKDAPYFVSYLLFKQLLPTYGTDQVYRGGLQVHTTIDLDLQKKAEAVVSRMGHEGALVALDPDTGEILAMVGGRNFENSKFNRAIQAFRQPGSSFKPIVYAAALEGGYRPIDHILDAPLNFANGWSPENYEKGYAGEVTFIYALAHSINTAAVRLAQIAGVGKVIDMARRMGVTSPYVPEDLSIALGTASVTPLEMAKAYCAFANNGYKVEPYGIKEITGKNGDSLEQNGPNLTSAMSPTTAVSMRSMLEQVVLWGTGSRARIDGYEMFGKTGTTNDCTDAWFIGGVPGLVVAVYVGNDNHKPLGSRQTGSVAAIPTWKAFVSYAVKKLNLPTKFNMPSDAGVEAITVCRRTGFIAARGCPSANVLVTSGQAPSAQCPWHGGSLSAARADANAPQLILAPIDDEATSNRYALGRPRSGGGETADSGTGTADATAASPDAAAQQPLPPENISVTKKKVTEKEAVKVPAPSQEANPYKQDHSQQQEMERKYQELLRKYNIKP